MSPELLPYVNAFIAAVGTGYGLCLLRPVRGQKATPYRPSNKELDDWAHRVGVEIVEELMRDPNRPVNIQAGTVSVLATFAPHKAVKDH